MLGKKITVQWLKKLYQPPAGSRKGDNGRLLIIAGSREYHGSLTLCAAMAAKIVDLVYLHISPANFGLLRKIRGGLAEFIFTPASYLKKILANADAVLIGPGMLPDSKTKKLVSFILKNYPNKKIILDAGALRVLDLKLLHKNCVLTPHADEFAAVFGEKPTPANARMLSKKYAGVIILKGPISYVCQNGEVFYNTTGNAGMTKGGTGDVLAGIIGGLLCKNDTFVGACAAVYANGLAGDNLKKRFGLYYSASELIPEVQIALSARP